MRELETIIYRRSGRERRATGTIVMRDAQAGFVKVKPEHPHWHTVWISSQEIEDGKPKENAPPRQRKQGKERRSGNPGDKTANPADDASESPTGLPEEEQVAELLQERGLPEKPAFTHPCNHCGLCCSLQLCPAAELAMPEAKAPCPALVIEPDPDDPDRNMARCGLVMLEKRVGASTSIARSLGIGLGCSMPDHKTTDQEIKDFDTQSQIKTLLL